MISRQRYQTWQKWHAQFGPEITAAHHEWIAQMSPILSEIERDCPDRSVKGLARRCRELASEFRNAKSDTKIKRAYEQFLGSWQRLGDAIGMHLMEVPKPPVASRLRASFVLPPRLPRNDPSIDQTAEQIETYYRGVQSGDRAAIRQTQFGFLRFTIATIDGVNPKLGRVYLSKAADWGGAAFFMKSGKNCYSPTGQSRLVVPTDEVVAWIEKYPDGTSDWSPG